MHSRWLIFVFVSFHRHFLRIFFKEKVIDCFLEKRWIDRRQNLFFWSNFFFYRRSITLTFSEELECIFLTSRFYWKPGHCEFLLIFVDHGDISIKLSNKYWQIIIETVYMIIIFIPNSGHSAVISGILHDSQESIIFNVEIVLVIVEELVFLDALHLHAFKVEVTCCRILLVCVEWVKSHAVDQRTRLVHLLFAAEKVHS